MGSTNLFSNNTGTWSCSISWLCVVSSLMYKGSKPLGLNFSSVLEFCKGMVFKKRCFLYIFFLFSFKRHQLLGSSNYRAGLCVGGGISFTGHNALLLAFLHCSWRIAFVRISTCACPFSSSLLASLGFLQLQWDVCISWHLMNHHSLLWMAGWLFMGCETAQELPEVTSWCSFRLLGKREQVMLF